MKTVGHYFFVFVCDACTCKCDLEGRCVLSLLPFTARDVDVLHLSRFSTLSFMLIPSALEHC
jgi:hypothetical protein